MPERLECEVLQKARYINTLTFTLPLPPTKVFPRLAVNKTILKPRLAAATGGQHLT